jgi:endonuclease YncB( thermonuclease family)
MPTSIIMPPSRLLEITDANTFEVKLNIRLFAIDSPEIHYPEGRDVSLLDPVLEGLPKLAAWKSLPEELREYLLPKLEKAGTHQRMWGVKAKEAFEGMVNEALTVEGKKRRRPLFYALPPKPFDRNGRIMAYVAPYVPREERTDSHLPESFNLRMVAEGWAAPYMHMENLPKEEDLAPAKMAFANAYYKKLGIWSEDRTPLLAYEFRALVRMANGGEGFTHPVYDARLLDNRDIKPLQPDEYIFLPVDCRVFD